MEEDDGRKSARKSVDKGLLKNIIRHTDAHNKIQEQNEMWKQWGLKKQSRERNQPYKYDGPARGYMRSDAALSPDAKKESLKWNRLLLEYEETRNDRWGHGGYKELYPEEFQEENVSGNESDESEKKVDSKRKVDTKHEDSRNTKRERKDKETSSKKSKRVGSDYFKGGVDHTRKKLKSKELDNDTGIRESRERDGKLKQKKDSKTKRLQSKESRKVSPDSAGSDVETGRRKMNVKSKVLENDFKGDRRKVVLNNDSKIKDPQRKEKAESKYTDNSFDRKRKTGTDNDLKRHDRKRRIESPGERVDRSARKQDKDQTSRKKIKR